MENDIGQAAANAVAAGHSLWGNILGLLDSNTQKKRIKQQGELEQQKIDIDSANSIVNRDMVRKQMEGLDLAANQAKRHEYLGSHDPIPFAREAYGQHALSKTSEPTEGILLGNKPVPGYVQFPLPESPEERARFGIPDSIDPAQQKTWSMKQEDYLKHATSGLDQTPFDQLPSEAQQAIVASYQQNAPEGVVVSPSDAIAAYRTSQRISSPLQMPGDYGLQPVSGKYTTPSGMELNLQSQAANVAQPVVTPSGQPSSFVRIGDEIKVNPAVLPPDEVAKQQDTIRNLAGSIQSIDSITDLLSKNDNLIGVGPSGGGPTGKAISFLEAVGGQPDNRSKQRELEMFRNKQVLNSVKLLTGSISEKELHFLQESVPTMTDSPATWNKYLSKLRVATEQAISQKAGLAGVHTDGGKLPPVSLPASVNPTGQKFNSAADVDAAKLPAGTPISVFDPAKGRYRPAVTQ